MSWSSYAAIPRPRVIDISIVVPFVRIAVIKFVKFRELFPKRKVRRSSLKSSLSGIVACILQFPVQMDVRVKLSISNIDLLQQRSSTMQCISDSR